MNGEKILAHLDRYRIEPVAVPGADGLSIVDTATSPNTAIVLVFDADGLPDGGRIVVEDGMGVSEAFGKRADASDSSMPLSHVLEYFGLRGGTSGFARRVASDYFAEHGADTADVQDVEAAAGGLLRAGGVGSLSERLDAEALGALSCVSSFGRAAYAFYAAGGERRKIRHQAAAAYPLLAGEMAGRVLVKMAIDQKRPLDETLIRTFGVNETGMPRLSKGLLRRIGGKALPDRGVPVQVLVNALSEIPVDWFPKEGAEWDAFTDIADTFFRRFGTEIGQNAGVLSSGASGKWVDFAERLAKSYVPTLPPDDLPDAQKAEWQPETDRSREAMLEASELAGDVIHAFRNFVILPLAAHAGVGAGTSAYVGPEQLAMASEIAGRLFYGGKSLTAMMEAQRRWHSQVNEIVAAAERVETDVTVTIVEEDGWAPLCDVWEAPNGVVIQPLTNPKELRAEGADLNHCVGGFSAKCKAGDAHILSFREVHADGSFKRLSTVEFARLDPGSQVLRKVQHHGKRNGAPPDSAKAAYSWFVSNVSAGVISLNHDGVMSFLAGRRRAAEEIDSYSVYDWRDEQALERAIAPWRPHLAKRFRSASIAEMMDMPELQDLIQSIAPAYGAFAR